MDELREEGFAADSPRSSLGQAEELLEALVWESVSLEFAFSDVRLEATGPSDMFFLNDGRWEVAVALSRHE